MRYRLCAEAAPAIGDKINTYPGTPVMRTSQFFHSQIDYKDLLDTSVQPGCRWLDVGCGHTIVPEWIRDSLSFQRELLARCEAAHGCDTSDSRPHKAGLQKHVGDCTVLPYPDGFFNLVTANMVAEHVADPLAFARQIHRVLAPGGRFVLHTPNRYYPLIFVTQLLPSGLVRRIANRVDGRANEDIFPTYYRMNTRKAISSLPGFNAVDIRCVPTGPLMRKMPLVSFAEWMLIKNASNPLLKDLQADWIAILEKPHDAVSSPQQTSTLDIVEELTT
jgi:SAM-dependent methyltransferase